MNYSIAYARIRILRAEMRRRSPKLVVQGFEQLTCPGQVIQLSGACIVGVQNRKNSSE